MKTCRHCGTPYRRSWAKAASYIAACDCTGHVRPGALVKEWLRYEKDVAAQMIASRGGWTLEQVGAAMGLTRERIRQIEAKAICRMAKKLALAVEASDIGRILATRAGSDPQVGYSQGDAATDREAHHKASDAYYVSAGPMSEHGLRVEAAIEAAEIAAARAWLASEAT